MYRVDDISSTSCSHGSASIFAPFMLACEYHLTTTIYTPNNIFAMISSLDYHIHSLLNSFIINIMSHELTLSHSCPLTTCLYNFTKLLLVINYVVHARCIKVSSRTTIVSLISSNLLVFEINWLCVDQEPLSPSVRIHKNPLTVIVILSNFIETNLI